MEANKLIRLQPKNEDKIKIKQDQKNLLSKVEKEFANEESKPWLKKVNLLINFILQW
jgi:hypothetical protein